MKEEQSPLFPIEFESDSEGGETGPCIPIKSQILELSRMLMARRAQFPVEPPKMTLKQQELSLRRRIDKHLKMYAITQGYEYPKVMKDAQQISDGKPRGELTLSELERFFAAVQQR